MPTPSPWRWPRRLLALALVALLVAGALAVQTAPSLPAPESSLGNTSGPWAHAQRWLQQLQAERQRPGARPSLWLAEADLNALVAPALASARPGARAQLDLEADFAQLRTNWPSAGGALWLNLDLRFDMAEQRPGLWPRLVSARLGRLPLPPSWVDAAAQRALDAKLGPAWRELPAAVTGWQALPGRLRVNWAQDRANWRQLAGTAGRLLPAPEREALAAHHAAWQAVLAQPAPADRTWAVPQSLQALARPALARVQEGRTQAEPELRALLLTLALHAVGRSPAPLLDQASPNPPPLRLVMAERDDMAQHFLLSAWLAWQGNEQFAQALGLGKELADARGGSGFSFNDLAADEAGSTLGRRAAANPAVMLAALATGVPEAGLFPRVDDLPEFLSEPEFRRRFGGVGAPAFDAERRKIRERIAALPLYQGWP
jgi:hypothetical protein